ncbi:MAG: Ca2+-transporting ATPase [Psychromonas sp.]
MVIILPGVLCDKRTEASFAMYIDAKQQGLSSLDAARLLQEHGENRLPSSKPSSLIIIFIKQFISPFIYILLVAAIVSFMVKQIPSAVFIIAVLFINAIIGTIQEYSAQKSAHALKQMIKGSARVIRDGNAQTINAEYVVPGDLLFLFSGGFTAFIFRG